MISRVPMQGTLLQALEAPISPRGKSELFPMRSQGIDAHNCRRTIDDDRFLHHQLPTQHAIHAYIATVLRKACAVINRDFSLTKLLL